MDHVDTEMPICGNVDAHTPTGIWGRKWHRIICAYLNEHFAIMNKTSTMECILIVSSGKWCQCWGVMNNLSWSTAPGKETGLSILFHNVCSALIDIICVAIHSCPDYWNELDIYSHFETFSMLPKDSCRGSRGTLWLSKHYNKGKIDGMPSDVSNLKNLDTAEIFSKAKEIHFRFLSLISTLKCTEKGDVIYSQTLIA